MGRKIDPRRMNEDKIILHLCAKEGSDSKPYRDAGYDVRIIDENINVLHYKPPFNVYGIIANPPCTMFSMARTNAKTPRNLEAGMLLVKACLSIVWECQYRIVRKARPSMPLKFWVLENPSTGYLRWFLGHPVFEYCQSEYGASLTKRTALWGCFNKPKRPLLFNQLPSGYKLGSKKEPGSHTDADGHRSRCPIDFAKAFYEANP